MSERVNVDQVRQLLAYDPATGILTLKCHRGKAGKGKPAGTLTSHGAIQIRIFGRNYLAHRLAWLIHYGVWPSLQIDHKDCEPSNNKIDNLREATHRQNHHNMPPKRSKSGAKGVYFSSGKNKPFVAYIVINGKRTHLGCFHSKDEAANAYASAATHHFGEFARTKGREIQ